MWGIDRQAGEETCKGQQTRQGTRVSQNTCARTGCRIALTNVGGHSRSSKCKPTLLSTQPKSATLAPIVCSTVAHVPKVPKVCVIPEAGTLQGCTRKTRNPSTRCFDITIIEHQTRVELSRILLAFLDTNRGRLPAKGGSERSSPRPLHTKGPREIRQVFVKQV